MEIAILILFLFVCLLSASFAKVTPQSNKKLFYTLIGIDSAAVLAMTILIFTDIR